MELVTTDMIITQPCQPHLVDLVEVPLVKSQDLGQQELLDKVIMEEALLVSGMLAVVADLHQQVFRVV
jgi:hypothetical protein